MSNNTSDVIIIGSVLASITLCSLFRAWRDRGVAKHNALAAQHQATTTTEEY